MTADWPVIQKNTGRNWPLTDETAAHDFHNSKICRARRYKFIRYQMQRGIVKGKFL